MRPEDKDAADNQMGERPIGTKNGTTGTTAGVSLTNEDKSGLPQGTGPAATPDTKAYSNAPNSDAVAINKSRGTGVQVNNNAMDADQANSYGDGQASAIAKVAKVTGESVPGMNSGPSLGRFDNPPGVMKQTGTPESVSQALDTVEDRWDGTDTEHRHPHPKDNDGTPTGLDRIWR